MWDLYVPVGKYNHHHRIERSASIGKEPESSLGKHVAVVDVVLVVVFVCIVVVFTQEKPFRVVVIIVVVFTTTPFRPASRTTPT